MLQSNIVWTSSEVVRATQAKSSGDWVATGVSIDSCAVQEGDLFISLDGQSQSVQEALSKGAVAVITDRDIDGIEEERLVVVRDVVQAVQILAQVARGRTGAKVISVLGRVENNETKEMLATVLRSQGQLHVGNKTNEAQWGEILQLSSMHAGTDYGVFQIGIDANEKITSFAQDLCPNIMIITSEIVEGVEVQSLFDGMTANGTVLVNRDIEAFDRVKRAATEKGLRVITFGQNELADSCLIKCLEAANGTKTKAKILGERVDYFIPTTGRRIAQNALAVLTVIKLMGCDLDKAIAALAKQGNLMHGRSHQRLNVGDVDNPVTLIDESYNAAPSSMQAAFKVLALVDPGRGGRRIAVLGGRLELGKRNDSYPEDMALPLKTADVDLVYTCGKHMKRLYDNLPANQQGAHKENSEELAQIVPDVLIPGDVVMVKGSLESKMGTVVEALRALPEKFKVKTKKTKNI